MDVKFLDLLLAANQTWHDSLLPPKEARRANDEHMLTTSKCSDYLSTIRKGQHHLRWTKRDTEAIEGCMVANKFAAN